MRLSFSYFILQFCCILSYHTVAINKFIGTYIFTEPGSSGEPGWSRVPTPTEGANKRGKKISICLHHHIAIKHVSFVVIVFIFQYFTVSASSRGRATSRGRSLSRDGGKDSGWHQSDWKPNKFPFTATPGPQKAAAELESELPADFLELILTDELLQLIADQTNLYASQYFQAHPDTLPHSRSKVWKPVSVPELKTFFGLTFPSSIGVLMK